MMTCCDAASASAQAQSETQQAAIQQKQLLRSWKRRK